MTRAIIISICIAIFGCGPTAQQASMMTGGQLVRAHFREIDIMDRADMDVVNEIIKRGGLPQFVGDEYADGARIHTWRAHDIWGPDTGPDMFDWIAMGYKSWPDVRADLGVVSSGSGATIYSSWGSARITRYGGGTIGIRSR